MTKISDKFIYTVFCVIFFFIYMNILSYPKIWDDISFLRINATDSQDVWNLVVFNFQKSNWAISRTYIVLVEYLFNGSVELYHFFNISFHFLNSILILFILKKWRIKKPYIIATIFLIHPIQVFVISPMIQFNTILSLTFTLCSIVFYNKYLKDSKRMSQILSLCFYFFSIKTKTSFVFIPLLIIPFAYYFDREKMKEHLKVFFPYFVIMIYAVLSLLYTGGTMQASYSVRNITGTKNFSLENDFSFRISLFINCLEHYMFSFFNFLKLSPLYGRFNSNTAWDISRGILYMALLTSGYIFGDKKVKLAILSFFIILAPFLGIIYAPYMGISPFSNHYQYLSIVILSGFFVYGIRRVIKDDAVYRLILITLLIVFSYSSFLYTKSYKNEVTYYSHAVLTKPTSLAAYINLARLLNGQNQFEKAYKILNSIDANEDNFTQAELLFVKSQKEKILGNIKKKEEILKRIKF